MHVVRLIVIPESKTRLVLITSCDVHKCAHSHLLSNNAVT